MKRRVFARFVVVSAGVLLIASCGHDRRSSPQIPTDQIYPQFEVDVDGTGLATISANFMTGITTDVVFSDGDHLTVKSGGTVVKMAPGKAAYSGTVQSGNTAGIPFTFDLERTSQASAPNSSGTLPAPMNMTAPSAGSSYSIPNDSITTTWSNFGQLDAMSVQISARCHTTIADEPPALIWFNVPINQDIGVAQIKLSDYGTYFDDGCKSYYDATFALWRTRSGTLDDHYAHCDSSASVCLPADYFDVRQVRSVAITLTP